MAPIDIIAIEQRARALRAAEMRRLEHIAAERLHACAVLAAEAVAGFAKAAADGVRHLLAWHPQRHA